MLRAFCGFKASAGIPATSFALRQFQVTTWPGPETVFHGVHILPPKKKKVTDGTIKNAVLQKENHLLNF